MGVRRRRPGVTVFALALMVAWVLAVPSKASAHAYLVRAMPAPGSTVPRMPAQIQLWFSDPLEVRFADVTVLAPDGKPIGAGPLTGDPHDAASLILPVHGSTGAGTYVVEWRVVSADGHPVAGHLTFSVGAASVPLSVAEPQSQGPPPVEGVSRFLQWAALLILPGLIGFWRILARWPALQRVPPETVRQVIGWTAAAGLVTTLFRLPVETRIQAEEPFWSGALSPIQWWVLIQNSTFGAVLLAQIPLLLLLALVAWRRDAGCRWLASGWRNDAWLVPAFAALLLMALAGHARHGPIPALDVTLDMVHLTAAAWWVGGLTGVAVWLLSGRRAAVRNLHREAAGSANAVPSGDWTALVRVAGWGFAASLAALILTGIRALLVMTPTPYSLTHTAWGVALIVKMSLVAGMGMLAAAHGLPLAGLLPFRWVRRTACAEWLLGIGAVVCATVLAVSAPAYTNPGPIHRLVSQSAGTADVRIDPNRAGINHLILELKDAKGRDMANLETVHVTVSMSDMPDMGETEVQVRSTAPGRYEAVGGFFSVAGRWRVEIHGLTRDYKDLEWATDVPVGQ
ncbi:MAG: copper resistance protein CopC [Kyrpidia sp.]|nr:copper resistance protein CopC [Kyrpidia sp.]